jgi:hypothetical protein
MNYHAAVGVVVGAGVGRRPKLGYFPHHICYGGRICACSAEIEGFLATSGPRYMLLLLIFVLLSLHWAGINALEKVLGHDETCGFTYILILAFQQQTCKAD